MNALNAAKTRYTTKAYDSSKKISPEQFDRLMEVLRLTPSSVNIQPWHFLVAQTPEAKARIAKAMTGRYAYNAPKVLESSHTLVFCTINDVSEQHLEQLLGQDDKVGRFKDEKAKQGQRETRAGYVDYYRNEKGNLATWLENQTFIALGQLLLAAGLEQVDATAMGGFDEDEIIREFNLKDQGLTPSVVVSLGFKSETDFNAKLPKSRLEKSLIFTQI